jgi:hypothetical protein
MKPFTRIAVVALWLIALLQLVRFIAGWQITPNGAAVLLWPKWAGGGGGRRIGGHGLARTTAVAILRPLVSRSTPANGSVGWTVVREPRAAHAGAEL